jgi:hypothetical protein
MEVGATIPLLEGKENDGLLMIPNKVLKMSVLWRFFLLKRRMIKVDTLVSEMPVKVSIIMLGNGHVKMFIFNEIKKNLSSSHPKHYDAIIAPFQKPITTRSTTESSVLRVLQPLHRRSEMI